MISMNICVNCKGIFRIYDVVLVSEKNAGERVYKIDCSNCGSQYEATIKAVAGPRVSAEELEGIKNIPT